MFKAISSSTRRSILKVLAKKEMHISGLAKELGISVPVAAKHCRILEENGLIERRKFGTSHVLRVRKDKFKFESLYDAIDIFREHHSIVVPRGSTVIDALKQIAGVTVKRVGDKEFVTSIDGEEGYYIYEIDGRMPDKSIGEFVLKRDSNIKLQKLVPVKKKEISIKIG